MDEKGQALQGRLEFFERNIHKLTKHMSAVVDQHKEGVNAGMKFSERLRSIAAQEPFPDMQDRFVALAEITERLSLERKQIMCDRAQADVIEKLNFVQEKVITPAKVLLKDRDGSIKLLQASQQRRDKAEGAGKTQIKSLELDVKEMKQQLNHTEKVVDNNMELFEAQRVEDLKDILEEFLRCEMYYHCRALEVLAPALKHIKSVDAESARENVRKELTAMNRNLTYT